MPSVTATLEEGIVPVSIQYGIQATQPATNLIINSAGMPMRGTPGGALAKIGVHAAEVAKVRAISGQKLCRGGSRIKSA